MLLRHFNLKFYTHKHERDFLELAFQGQHWIIYEFLLYHPLVEICFPGGLYSKCTNLFPPSVYRHAGIPLHLWVTLVSVVLVFRNSNLSSA